MRKGQPQVRAWPKVLSLQNVTKNPFPTPIPQIPDLSDRANVLRPMDSLKAVTQSEDGFQCPFSQPRDGRNIRTHLSAARKDSHSCVLNRVLILLARKFAVEGRGITADSSYACGMAGPCRHRGSALVDLRAKSGG